MYICIRMLPCVFFFFFWRLFALRVHKEGREKTVGTWYKNIYLCCLRTMGDLWKYINLVAL